MHIRRGRGASDSESRPSRPGRGAIGPGETEPDKQPTPHKRGHTAPQWRGMPGGWNGDGAAAPAAASSVSLVPFVPLVRATIFRADYDKGAEKAQPRSAGRCTAAARTTAEGGTATQGRSRGYRRTRRGEGPSPADHQHRGGRDTREPRSPSGRGLQINPLHHTMNGGSAARQAAGNQHRSTAKGRTGRGASADHG